MIIATKGAARKQRRTKAVDVAFALTSQFDQKAFSSTYEIQKRAERNFKSRNSTPQCLSLTVEKIEMAFEGHSKMNFADDRSVESHDTTLFGQFASPTRTYIVEIYRLCWDRTKNHDIIANKLLLGDVSIVQLKSPSEYTALLKITIRIQSFTNNHHPDPQLY